MVAGWLTIGQRGCNCLLLTSTVVAVTPGIGLHVWLATLLRQYGIGKADTGNQHVRMAGHIYFTNSIQRSFTVEILT
jgi:hypothetical protein